MIWIIAGTYRAGLEEAVKHSLEPRTFKIMSGPDSACGYRIQDADRVIWAWNYHESPAMENPSVRDRLRSDATAPTPHLAATKTEGE